MGAQSATRSQMLMTLRNRMPNASLRRIGDMLNNANVLALEKPKTETTQSQTFLSVAFGLVLEGTLRVHEGGETRWVRPGELFGMNQYQQTGKEASISVTCATQAVRVLVFSSADVANMGLIRARPAAG